MLAGIEFYPDVVTESENLSIALVDIFMEREKQEYGFLGGVVETEGMRLYTSPDEKRLPHPFFHLLDLKRYPHFSLHTQLQMQYYIVVWRANPTMPHTALIFVKPLTETRRMLQVWGNLGINYFDHPDTLGQLGLEWDYIRTVVTPYAKITQSVGMVLSPMTMDAIETHRWDRCKPRWSKKEMQAIPAYIEDHYSDFRATDDWLKGEYSGLPLCGVIQINEWINEGETTQYYAEKLAKRLRCHFREKQQKMSQWCFIDDTLREGGETYPVLVKGGIRVGFIAVYGEGEETLLHQAIQEMHQALPLGWVLLNRQVKMVVCHPYTLDFMYGGRPSRFRYTGLDVLTPDNLIDDHEGDVGEITLLSDRDNGYGEKEAALYDDVRFSTRPFYASRQAARFSAPRSRQLNIIGREINNRTRLILPLIKQ